MVRQQFGLVRWHDYVVGGHATNKSCNKQVFIRPQIDHSDQQKQSSNGTQCSSGLPNILGLICPSPWIRDSRDSSCLGCVHRFTNLLVGSMVHPDCRKYPFFFKPTSWCRAPLSFYTNTICSTAVSNITAVPILAVIGGKYFEPKQFNGVYILRFGFASVLISLATLNIAFPQVPAIGYILNPVTHTTPRTGSPSFNGFSSVQLLLMCHGFALAKHSLLFMRKGVLTLRDPEMDTRQKWWEEKRSNGCHGWGSGLGMERYIERQIAWNIWEFNR